MNREKQQRPGWTEYFLDIAKAVGRRATCLRRRYGAIIVKDKIIISTGYNGAPRGEANCIDTGICERERLHVPKGQNYELCVAVHAEQNAIIQAATLAQSIEGATIDVTNQPCSICAKMIINAGIERIVVEDGYPDKMAQDMLREAGLAIEMLTDEDGAK